MATEPLSHQTPAHPRIDALGAPTAARVARAPWAAAGARFYLPQLDGLRFVAYVLVFFSHCQWAPDSVVRIPLLGPGLILLHRYGGLGVDLFLVLSAFLITSLLLIEDKTHRRVSLRAFYARRSLRIWPLYYFYLALSFVGVPLALGIFRTPELQAGLREHTAAYALFLGNFSSLWSSHLPPENTGHLWTISLEEQFYMVWPLAFVAFVDHPRRLARFLVGMVVVGMSSRFAVVYLGIERAAWTTFFTRLDPFALGALLALHRWYVPRREGWVWLQVGLGSALVGAAAAGPLLKLQTFHIVWQYVAIALGFTLIVDATVDRGSRRLLPMLHHPAAVWMGKLSFGLYVYHQLCITLGGWLASQLGLDIQSRPGWVFIVVVPFLIAIAAAQVSYRLIEAPFLRLKRRFTLVPSRDP